MLAKTKEMDLNTKDMMQNLEEIWGTMNPQILSSIIGAEVFPEEP